VCSSDLEGTNYCENIGSNRKPVTVSVTQRAAAANITLNGTTLCAGTTATLTASTSIASPTFKWYVSTTATTPFYTGASYTTSALAGDSTFYVSVEGTNYCENIGSNRKPVTVSVTQRAAATNITLNGTTICSGTTATLTASTSIASPTFKWYVSTAATTPFYTGASYTTSALAGDSTFYVSVEGTNYCENIGSNRKPVTVNVTTLASAGDITLNGDTICSGTTTTLTASTGIASPTFNWYVSAMATTSFYTGASYTTSALTADTTFFVSVSGTGSCENTSGTRKQVTVTVRDTLDGGTIGTDQTICSNITPATINELIAARGGSIHYSYQWQSSTDSLNWSNSTGATATNFLPATLAVTTWFRRVTTDDCGTVYSNIVKITVYACPIVAIEENDSICIGTTTLLSPHTGGSWVSSNTGVATIQNNGLVTGVAIGYAVFTFTDANNCSATSDTVRVNSFPIVNDITGENKVCVGSTVQLSSTTTGGVWSRNNTNATISNPSANPVTITGVSEGNTYITYTVGVGVCQSKKTFPLKVISNTPPQVLIGF
jgi:hypothetical protein